MRQNDECLRVTSKFIVAILVCLSFDVFSQNGYVKINRDSIRIGYIKKYTNPSTSLTGIEFWRTKKDKNPMRISMSDIYEYAVDKDTIRILENYPPYKGIMEAKVVRSGKLNLLMLSPDKYNSGPVYYTYVLENSTTQYIRTVPKKGSNFFEVLQDFIPYDFLKAYVELYGNKVGYNEVAQIVTLFNQNRLINSASLKHLDIKDITFSQIDNLIENAALFIGKNEQAFSVLDQLRKQFGAAKNIGISENDEVDGQLFMYELSCGVVSFLVSPKKELIDAILYTPYDFVTRKEVTNYLDSHYHGTGTFVTYEIAFEVKDYLEKYAVVMVAKTP